MTRLTPLAAAVSGLCLAAVLALPAGAQTSSNIIFQSNLDQHPGYNDCWGYTAPNGDEYALLGCTTGTSVINITDRANPYETGFIPGPTSTWRDIKTYSTYAYVTNETSGGLEIIDLSDPENPVDLPNYTGFSSAHNLYIDTTTARCYISGSNLSTGGARILSLANPTAPVEVGNWNVAYFHDIMVQNDVLYGSAINIDTLYILDVANPASISVLGTISGYPNAFTHNAWVTPDDQYVMTTDETTGAACRMWDISNPAAAFETDNYRPNPATIPHNTHIVGDLAVISHYTLGVRVVDISDPYNLQEVAYYDTWPADDGGGFNGCWGAYCFFPNSPELIVASDLSTGLYVLEYRGQLGTVSGSITQSGLPGYVIGGADVQVVETGVSSVSDDLGDYTVQDVAGSVTLQVSAFGYQTANVPVSITAGGTSTVDVSLVPVPGAVVSGTVTAAAGGAPIPDAVIEVVGTPLVRTADGAGAYVHGSVPAGVTTIRARAFGYNAFESTLTVPSSGTINLDFSLNAAFVVDDFESGVGGWAVSGNATTGQWELGDPQPTDGGAVQTGDDHTPAPGVNAWITELAAGSSVGSFDVDNGQTILTSPLFSLAGLTDPHVSFHRWYVTGGGGNSTTDFWVAEVSSDAGASWTLLETTDQGDPQWVEIDRRISSFVTPSNIMRFRFTAQDTGAGSITEAGLDDFMIYDVEAGGAVVDAPVVAPAVTELALGANSPNPFRSGETTTLGFSLPQSAKVRADVYDVAGRQVAEVANGVFDAGSHRLTWDGRTGHGAPAPAGVYFLRLRTTDGERSTKMLLMR